MSTLRFCSALVSLSIVTLAGCATSVDDESNPSSEAALAAGDQAQACGTPHAVLGAINAKYQSFGGCSSFLGAPTSDEQTAPDGVGRYTVFQFGSIYWSPSTGAHEVHGGIRSRWGQLGWEAGVLGYPLSDEVTVPDGRGRYNRFERGEIHWTATTGAHEVHGRIFEGWEQAGKQSGFLGYPVSGEFGVIGGRRVNFEHGAIIWLAASNSFRYISR